MRRAVAAGLAAALLAACGAPAVPIDSAPRPESPPAASATAVAAPRRPATGTPTPAATATASDVAAAFTGPALAAAIDADAIRRHLEALERIAHEHGGNRAAGTTGFEESVEYVATMLAAAGYDVMRQPFTYPGGAGVNLVAERMGREPGEVVMVGAHLDSVVAGPGINDDGSGVATLLVAAERLALLAPPSRTIRLAFWGAEEPGRHGSQAYVANLTGSQRAAIGAYLNLEMLGSPNYVRFVHADAVAADGSDAITRLFAGHFEQAGLAWEPIDLGGKSDHAAFAEAGIPTGGLFGGGIEPKTREQAAAFGGIAGEPADPCSHAACDTVANLNVAALDEMADALAHVLAALAGG